MTTETATAPAAAGDMTEEDAIAAFEALAAAKVEASDDDEPTEETPAAPAAVEVPATVPAAPAPAVAATDIWSSASPEVRAAHEADLERERQKYRSDIGRQAAHQARIKFLEEQLAARTATPAAATTTTAEAPVALRERPAIKKSLEDYPEVVGPLLDAIEPALAENESFRRELSTLSEHRRAGVIASQEQALEAAHPDWREACGSKEFADWLDVQPPAIRQIVERNGQQVVDAQEAIAMVGNFKAHFALTHPQTPPAVIPTPAPTDLSARRAAQLAAVTSVPKGAPVAIPDGAPGGSEAALFDHFVAKKAKKG